MNKESLTTRPNNDKKKQRMKNEEQKLATLILLKIQLKSSNKCTLKTIIFLMKFHWLKTYENSAPIDVPTSPTLPIFFSKTPHLPTLATIYIHI